MRLKVPGVKLWITVQSLSLLERFIRSRAFGSGVNRLNMGMELRMDFQRGVGWNM